MDGIASSTVVELVYTKKELKDMINVWLDKEDLVAVSWPIHSTRQITAFRLVREEEIEDEDTSDT